jgi:hypothetical protein
MADSEKAKKLFQQAGPALSRVPVKAAAALKPAAKTEVSDRVEDALRQLLVVEIGELAEQGKGGQKCWAAVLLKIAEQRARSADAPKHAIARLIADILDPNHAVPAERRDEVAGFCRKIVEQARGVRLGRLNRLRRTAKPFAAEALGLFGDDRRERPFGQGGERHLNLQQLLARLDPHQPFEVQATAVKILPDIVNQELRNAPPVVQQRQQQLRGLAQAVGMVGSTKYFGSLAPKMRDVCEARMTALKNRIDKAGRRP